MELASKYTPQEVESKWYQYWLDHKLFSSKPDDREPYTIVIPPPNVTGVLHMGHMLNNTIQDILVRRKRMEGKNACWVPGTDHASIATEAKVVKKLAAEGIRKRDLTREEFLKHAWDWTHEHGGIILKQLRRLGASCDWDRTAFTMDETRSKSVIKVFVDLYNKGLIYRGLRMVNWDPKAQTALSTEEVVYKEEQSHLFHLKYYLADTTVIVNEEALIAEGNVIHKDEKGYYAVVATTRPETIMGDTAMCVNPKDSKNQWLRGKKVIVPLVNRVIPVIEDRYVDIEFGTGCLKVTPAHDTNDYMLGTQVSLFANIAKKEMHGLQASTIVNVAGENFDGAQLSSVVNYAGSLNGAQVSSVVNITKNKSSGAQIGIVNVAADTLDGLQVSAGVNYAKATHLQVTAGVNAAHSAPIQVVAGVDYATYSKIQVAAGVNASHVNEKLQVGVVNYATIEKGRQWGIVNVCARCEKSPIGLINIVGNGVWSVNPYLNEMGALGGSIHLGTAYFYTNIDWAAFFKKGSGFGEFEKFYEHGFGIGTQFGKYGSHFELEYTFFNVYDKLRLDDDGKFGYHHRGRVGYVYQVLPFFGLSVGGTLNLTSEGYLNKLLLKPLGDYHDDVSYKNHKGRWWPGFYAGLTFGRF